MELETNQNGKTSYTIIRNGVAGNFDTVARMTNLVTETVNFDKGFNRDIKKYFTALGFNPYNSDEQILTQVIEFIKQNVKYIPDKAGKLESISDARETLENGFGDCDDLTILAASILGVLGFEDVNFILASYNSKSTFEHIYLQVIGRDKKTYTIDLTLPNTTLNQELKPIQKQAVPVFHQNLSQKISGAIFALKFGTKKLATDTVNTIPYAIQFMPLGLVSANLLQQGINLISNADLSQMSLNQLGKEINSQLDSLAKLIINRQITDSQAKTLAMQISAQLGTYQPKSFESENFTEIKNIIKEKVKYIYYLIDITPELNLNPKGMILAGVTVIGFIAYKLYKRKGVF